MKVRDKSKEELKEQAKGFLNYADETGKITERQRKKISKTLGLNEPDKKSFFERLLNKEGNNVDITDKATIQKFLQKKNIQFGELYEEYEQCLKAKHFSEHFCKKYRIHNGEKLVEYLYSTNNSKALENLKSEDGIGDWCLNDNSIYNIGKLIFEKYPEVSAKQFISILEEIFEHGDVDNHIEALEYLIKGYPEIVIEDLILLFKRIRLHYDDDIEILKIIFEEVKNISIHEKCGLLGPLFRFQNYYHVDPNHVKLLLKKYPNIGIGELFGLRHICGGIEGYYAKYDVLSLIFEKYPDITIYELITLGFRHGGRYFFSNANYGALKIIFEKYPNITVKNLIHLMDDEYNLVFSTYKKGRSYKFRYDMDEEFEKFFSEKQEDLTFTIEQNLKYIFKIFPTDIDFCDNIWIWELLYRITNSPNSPNNFFIDKYPNISSARQLALLDKSPYFKHMFPSRCASGYNDFCIHNPKISPQDLEGLFKIGSKLKFKDIDYEDLEIILKKYNIDLQTLGNSKGLLDVLKQAEPGNLKIILDKYDIDLQTLTNSKCLLDILEQANPDNFKTILDKYDIDLQTLTNSKGLLDILKQANPDNFKTILDKYDIDLQTLANLKGSLLYITGHAAPSNLKIILDKYDIDLQTLGNMEGLFFYKTNQAEPGNLKIILDKYDIDLQTLTNSEGLLGVLRQANPGNLKIILDKYDIDLQTLTNSKGLLDILKQANPDNLKALINRYPEITLEELKSSYDSLKEYGTLFIEILNFRTITPSQKSLDILDLSMDYTKKHDEIFENIENKDEINDKNWIDIVGLYSAIEYFEDDKTISDEIKSSIRGVVNNEDKKDSIKDFIYKKLFELLKKSLSDQSKLNDEEIALLAVLNKKGLWNMGQSESLAKFIYQINKLDKNYKFNKSFTEIKGGINKFINVHKKDSNELLNSFYQVSTSLLEKSPAIYRNVVKLLNKLDSKEQEIFYKEIFPLYNVELFLGENPGQYEMLGKEFNNNVEGQLIPMHKRIKKLLDKLDIETKIDVNSLLLEEKNILVENIKQLFKEKFGIKKIPTEFSKENIESIRWHSTYLSNMNDLDDEKSAVLGYFLALKLDGKRNEFRTGKDFDPSEYMDGSKVYILREYLSNRSERNSVYKLENIEENDKIFLQENESNTIIGNTNGITDRLKTIEGNIKTLLDDDIYSERQRIIKKYIDKNLGKLLAKQFQILSGKNIPLSDEENKILSGLSSELGDNLTDIKNIQKLQNECKSISAIVNFVNKILNENLPKEIQDFENLCKPSNEHLELLKKIGINLEDNSIVSSNSYLIYIESGIKKGKNKLIQEEYNSLNEYIIKVNKELTDLYSIKDRLTALYGDFKNKIIDKYFDNTELKERFESMSPYFFTKADVEKENIVSLMTNDLDIVIKNIRQCLSCKDEGCNNDTDLSFGCEDRFFITTSHKEGDTSFADELVTLLPRTPKEEGFTFVMDRIYGNNGSTDILLNNIQVILKKINKLSPGLKKQLSIFVPDGIGLTLNEEGIQKLKKGYNGISINKQGITVTIEEQPITDSYHEFGGIDCRDTGNANISGYLIRF